MGGRYHTLHSLSFMVIVIFVFLHVASYGWQIDTFRLLCDRSASSVRRILFVITTVVLKLVHVTFH